MKRKSDDFLGNKENEEKDDGTAAADTQISGQSGSDKEALGERADRETAVPAGGSYSCRSAY